STFCFLPSLQPQQLRLRRSQRKSGALIPSHFNKAGYRLEIVTSSRQWRLEADRKRCLQRREELGIVWLYIK
ncbi:unnamed protein product, partial [Prunus brigantina]